MSYLAERREEEKERRRAEMVDAAEELYAEVVFHFTGPQGNSDFVERFGLHFS